VNRFRQGLNNFMASIRRDNPEANWGNLLTGVVILVLIAAFSIWYFGNTSEDRGGLLNEIFNAQETQTEETAGTPNIVTVQAGEGLWQVAERVCGDGEMYNLIAAENGLSVWSEISEGQELTVSCNY